jgi:hypothetical protein
MKSIGQNSCEDRLLVNIALLKKRHEKFEFRFFKELPPVILFDRIIAMKSSRFVFITVVLLIIVFTYAAVSKLIDYRAFAAQIGQSPLLNPIAKWVPLTIIIIEFTVSLLLSNKRLRTVGLFMSFSLMVLFTTYIIFITRFSDYIPCSCGGILEDMNWNQHLVFNLALLSITFTSIIAHIRNYV